MQVRENFLNGAAGKAALAIAFARHASIGSVVTCGERELPERGVEVAGDDVRYSASVDGFRCRSTSTYRSHSAEASANVAAVVALLDSCRGGRP